MEWSTFLLLVLVIVIATIIYSRWTTPPLTVAKLNVGEITLETLAFHNGFDWSRPILVSIQGKIFDVSKDGEVYGPHKEKSKFAGREISRALAKGSAEEEDFCDKLDDLTDNEKARLAEQLSSFERNYDAVGQVVPPITLTMEELADYNGTDPNKPMYIAIQGTIYDVTKGRQFYGPDGVYPFAGREVARAFALLSTELDDCNDNLEGLTRYELDNMHSWRAKFNSKYSIVGTIKNKKA